MERIRRGGAITDPDTLIIIKIDDTTYTAKDGMTWSEWCSSSYNTIGAKVSGETIVSSDGSKTLRRIANALRLVVSPDVKIYPESQFTYVFD